MCFYFLNFLAIKHPGHSERAFFPCPWTSHGVFPSLFPFSVKLESHVPTAHSWERGRLWLDSPKEVRGSKQSVRPRIEDKTFFPHLSSVPHVTTSIRISLVGRGLPSRTSPCVCERRHRGSPCALFHPEKDGKGASKRRDREEERNQKPRNFAAPHINQERGGGGGELKGGGGGDYGKS